MLLPRTWSTAAQLARQQFIRMLTQVRRLHSAGSSASTSLICAFAAATQSPASPEEVAHSTRLACAGPVRQVCDPLIAIRLEIFYRPFNIEVQHADF
jgi:hypothetical protein